MCMSTEEVKKILANAWSSGDQANLRGANLRGADLKSASLKGANLEGADLKGADLKGAGLKGASLEGANLSCADLRDADLKGANLRGANLRGASLEGAYLEGAYLMRAELEGAYLTCAYLEGANLMGAYLRGATGWEQTEWARQAKQQLRYVLSYSQSDAPALIQKIKAGKIDGTQYEGDCCGLIGSLGNDQAVVKIPDYAKGLHNLSEQLFFQIRKGDTPENSAFSKLALEVCMEFA
jgi:hypothetical protein